MKKEFRLTIEYAGTREYGEWEAYVAETVNGEVVEQVVVLTAHGRDPLGAVTKLAILQATVLDGYRRK